MTAERQWASSSVDPLEDSGISATAESRTGMVISIDTVAFQQKLRQEMTDIMQQVRMNQHCFKVMPDQRPHSKKLACQTCGWSSLICVSSSKCVYMCVKLRVHFGSNLGPIWVHFGSILGPFWVHFGSISGRFRVHFGSILGPFWVHFGSISGPSRVHFGSISGPFWVHFAYCLSGEAASNKNRFSDKNQCSDKNTLQTRILV